VVKTGSTPAADKELILPSEFHCGLWLHHVTAAKLPPELIAATQDNVSMFVIPSGAVPHVSEAF